MARPTKYRAEFAEQSLKLTRLGATDKQIGDFLGVTERSINGWKITHPEFRAALIEGKEMADAEVAQSLFKRATGYQHAAEKIVIDVKTGSAHREDYTEQYAPDTTACIFWLKNRRPDLWRDRIDNTHSAPDGGPIQVHVVNYGQS